ncbi:6315_t:CDS:2 [Scutellospora calospora]|uniref:6315_t:CDS:1 n=1 Tax=Scutellospora calospora TaxID=85575 RepID=A0ACA9KPZ9_9GLOM|nr:6315_t:CDS:2 [Scutellospora calospora]
MDLNLESLDIEDECSVFSVDSKVPLLLDDEYFNDTSPQEEIEELNNDTSRIYERQIDRSSRINIIGRQGISGSSWAAYVNVTCLIAGTGIFGLPYAIKQGGWVGITLIALLMLMTQYTSIILIKCLYYDGKTRLNSYADIGYHAYGNIGKYLLVGIFNNAILIGIPIFLLLIAGKNLDNLVTVHFETHLGIRVWICIAAALISIPFILMKSLKDVFFLSIFGALSTLFSVIAVAALSCRDFTESLNYNDTSSHNLYQIPMSFAAVSLTYGGNCLFPSIEGNMRRPKDWNKVVTAALITCTIMYLIVAFSGYYVFGDCKIIRTTQHEGPILTIATIFITIDILLTAPILLTSFASEAEEFLNITSEHYSVISEFILRVIFRSSIVIGCAIVAIFMPLLGDFMALLGALAMYCLVFIFPVIFYIKLFGWSKLSILDLICSLIVVFIGFSGYVIAVIDAISSLIKDFQSK